LRPSSAALWELTALSRPKDQGRKKGEREKGTLEKWNKMKEKKARGKGKGGKN